MLELLTYLRQNGFKTFIVSGGTVEFMRVFAEKVYGIPPEQVVGTSFVTKFQTGADGVPVLMRERKIDFVDDGPGKPVGIQKFIGRRPISPLAIPTEICKCFSGLLPVQGRGSPVW